MGRTTQLSAQNTELAEYFHLSMLVEILLLLLTLFLVVYFWITKHYGYFKKKGLAEAPGTFPFGSEHMWQMMTRKITAIGGFKMIIEKFPDDKLFGVYHFGQRNIVVKDLELAKIILIKDADHFIDRPAIDTEGSVKEADKIFAYFLTNLKGEEWKKMRTLVSPVFTSGKLKMMVPHIEKCADNMEELFETAVNNKEILDAKDVFGKFTLDAIATSGFGIESNSFKNPDSAFRRTALRMVRADGYGSFWDIPKFMFLFVFPKLGRSLGLSALPSGTVEFFAKILRQTVAQRRQSGTRRNDIIDLLLDETDRDGKDPKSDDEQEKLDLELALISNALIFFFAGFDTSSTTMSQVIFSFLKKPSVQDRARQEIMDVIGDSETITADHLKDLKYLENVINEALRHNGLITNLQRICTKDYKVPDTDFTIIKGTPVNVEFSGLADECFANGSEFDPDNFDVNNNPNKYGFSGFGQGPRNCIGMRYAYMALKMALVKTLIKYKVVPCEKTVEKLQFDVAKNDFNGGVKFRMEKVIEDI